MQGYNFTERVRRVLAQARNEAATLGHEFVGVEHLLLSLLRDGGVASIVMVNLGVDATDVQHRIKQVLKPGKASVASSSRDLPYTSPAKRTLELAMSEARDLHHSYVGTEHLLLGILGEKKNIGAQVLSSLGVTLDRARRETLRTIGTELQPAPSPPPGERPIHVTLTLTYSNSAVINLSFRDPTEAARYLTSQ